MFQWHARHSLECLILFFLACELRCRRTLDLLSAWSFRGVVVSIWIPSLLRVALLFVLQTSQLAFRRRLLCPFVLGALKQRCPRNVPTSVCECVCVCVFCLVCGDVSVSELTSSRCFVWVQLRLSVCWDKGVSNGVHAILPKNQCSRKWSSAFLHDASDPLYPTLLCTNM